MLTLRRGVARVGWVLLGLWAAAWIAIVVGARSGSPNPPPIDAAFVISFTVPLVGIPLVIFLFWRLVLWIGQGFWQHRRAPSVSETKTFRVGPEFWTVRTMALLGALLFVAYGVFGARAELALGGDHASRAFGGLVAYAAIGAVVGAIMARFLPR
jgi:hypothetical protein